jgi:hypothetical protein
MFCHSFDEALIVAKTKVKMMRKIHYIYKDALDSLWLVRQSYISEPSARWILVCETGCYL